MHNGGMRPRYPLLRRVGRGGLMFLPLLNVATEKFLLSMGHEMQLQEQVEFIGKHIQPIFTHSPWGASLDFYYAGLWNLHPNYVTKMRDYKLSLEKILAVLFRLRTVRGQKYELAQLDATMESLL